MKRITIITFAVFMVEAIIHYNIGAKSATKRAEIQTDGVGGTSVIPANPQMPPLKDLGNMAIWVALFAFITAKIIEKSN